jgi:hypothetical protein
MNRQFRTIFLNAASGLTIPASGNSEYFFKKYFCTFMEEIDTVMDEIDTLMNLIQERNV